MNKDGLQAAISSKTQLPACHQQGFTAFSWVVETT